MSDCRATVVPVGITTFGFNHGTINHFNSPGITEINSFLPCRNTPS